MSERQPSNDTTMDTVPTEKDGPLAVAASPAEVAVPPTPSAASHHAAHLDTSPPSVEDAEGPPLPDGLGDELDDEAGHPQDPEEEALPGDELLLKRAKAGSGFVNIYWDKHRGAWSARLDGGVFVGYYDTALQAARGRRDRIASIQAHKPQVPAAGTRSEGDKRPRAVPERFQPRAPTLTRTPNLEPYVHAR